MKFSVLIPTRNRFEYLKTAIASILLQDYTDYEIIISDNDSTDDIQEYVQSLNQPQIRYSKTDRFISVTDNWNRSFDLAQGDYLIMIGDDDCLLKGYFFQMERWIERFEHPDLIYSDALLYAYPGVLKDHPNGQLRTVGNCSYWKQTAPFLLAKEKADRFADQMMSFRYAFSFNIQYGLIRRSFAEQLRFQGAFFHSPYPDYYATPLLFKKARSIAVCPFPMTLIGITSKSFGYFYFNNKEQQGVEFLKNEEDRNVYAEVKEHILPGTIMNTTWLFSLIALQKNHLLVDIDFAQYRRLQIIKCLQNRSNIKELCVSLRAREWLSYLIEIPLVWAIRKIMGRHILKRLQSRFLLQHPLTFQQYEKKYHSVLEIIDDFEGAFQ